MTASCIKLSPRLMTAVRFVRPGHLLCDVGTDHAYLPIYLCQTGILSPLPPEEICAIASDIREGPVERARLHIAAAGLTEQILTVRTPGLTGLDGYAPTDITIFGMGGELIASILEQAAFVRLPDVRLILQPMTHQEILRKWLFNNGFCIVEECLSAEEQRIYQTICANYAPDVPSAPYDRAELLTGSAYRPEQAALHVELIRRTKKTVAARREARAGAGYEAEEEDVLLSALTEQEKRVLSSRKGGIQ